MPALVNLDVHTHPNARSNRLELKGNTLHVYVTAPAQEGKANQAVIALLAEHLRVAKSRVIIIRGHASRLKRIEVVDLRPEEVRKKLGL